MGYTCSVGGKCTGLRIDGGFGIWNLSISSSLFLLGGQDGADGYCALQLSFYKAKV